jgi:transcriptional regulator with XRE-family HTH domain
MRSNRPSDTEKRAKMSEDTSIKPSERKSAPSNDSIEANSSLFAESEDLGLGAGPLAQLREQESAYMKVVGARLRKARKAAGLSESAAGLALDHNGVTQISLFENGHRFPSMLNLKRLADLYGVTTDYLLGRNEDILSCPEEGNQAVLRGVMVATLTHDFTTFVNGMAQRNALMIQGLSSDRVLLRSVAGLSEDLVQALEVFKRYAPDFEGIRGGAKLGRLVGELHGSMGECIRRQRMEQAMADHELVVPAPEVVRQKVEQMMLTL